MFCFHHSLAIATHLPQASTQTQPTLVRMEDRLYAAFRLRNARNYVVGDPDQEVISGDDLGNEIPNVERFNFVEDDGEGLPEGTAPPPLRLLTDGEVSIIYLTNRAVGYRIENFMRKAIRRELRIHANDYDFHSSRESSNRCFILLKRRIEDSLSYWCKFDSAIKMEVIQFNEANGRNTASTAITLQGYCDYQIRIAEIYDREDEDVVFDEYNVLWQFLKCYFDEDLEIYDDYHDDMMRNEAWFKSLFPEGVLYEFDENGNVIPPAVLK